MDNSLIFDSVLSCFSDNTIRERSYYPEFRRRWESLFREALEKDDYYDVSAASVYTVAHSFDGVDALFHFDQLKLADWYRQDCTRRKPLVFLPKTFRHSKKTGLSYHDSKCSYDPLAPESALDEHHRNIIAAALPQLPPELCIVYGNKWVDSRFNSFLTGRLSLFLIETDYVPAFLGSPFEVCLYLFLMDCCIIKENCAKVKDDQLKEFLHIFRPSPMLKIKGLL